MTETPRWTLPTSYRELVALGRKFDAGPEPLVNGYLWTEMSQFRDGQRFVMFAEYRGTDAWAINVHGSNLNRKGYFEYEPLNSNKGDDFLDRARYGTAREAIEIANHYRNAVTAWAGPWKQANPTGVYDYSHFYDSDDHRIFKALALAYAAHRGQVRKYGGNDPVPYITHPESIAAQTEAWVKEHTPQERVLMVSAAWLHDVIEDCDKRFAEEIRVIDPAVFHLVGELTNPSKQRPDLKRADRKALDREHLQHVSARAKVIKLIDRRSNLMEIAGQDAPLDFKHLYARESLALLDALRSPETLWLEAELEVWVKNLLDAKE